MQAPADLKIEKFKIKWPLYIILTRTLVPQGSSHIELHYMEYMLHLLQYKYCVQIDHISCLSFLGIWIGVLFLHMIIYILAHWGQSWCMIKGCMVNQYCFDVKPFNLAACYIMKCYDYVHQNGRPLTTVYNNVQL